MTGNYHQWSDALKAKLFGNADKDRNYFLDKIFRENHWCSHCSWWAGIQLQDSPDSLKFFLIEGGIISKRNLQFVKCKKVEVMSGEELLFLSSDHRLEVN